MFTAVSMLGKRLIQKPIAIFMRLAQRIKAISVQFILRITRANTGSFR
jgi:hypothetical protein